MKDMKLKTRPGGRIAASRSAATIAVLLGFCAVSAALGQTGAAGLASTVLPTPFEILEPLESGHGATMRLDLEHYVALKGRNHVRLESFALKPGREVDLELEQFAVFGGDTLFVLGTAADDKTVSPPEVTFLRGNVQGAENSHVFLSISPQGSAGYVRLADETFVLLTDWSVAALPEHPRDCLIVESQCVPAEYVDRPFACSVLEVPGAGSPSPGRGGTLVRGAAAALYRVGWSSSHPGITLKPSPCAIAQRSHDGAALGRCRLEARR